MYAYCLNNPVGRTDDDGYVSYDCLDNDDGDALDDEGQTAMGAYLGGDNFRGTMVPTQSKTNLRTKMTSIRRNYWKTEAKLSENLPKGKTNISSSGTYYLTQQNFNLMKNGFAPIGIDGHKVNLHHYRGISNDLYAFFEATHRDHYSNFADLHPWIYGGK